MPVWLRKFTFNKLKGWYKKQNNQDKKNNDNFGLTGVAKEEALKNRKNSPLNNMSRSPLKDK